MDNGTFTRVLAPAEVIFTEGEQADQAYIIRSGTVEIVTECDGENVVLCVLGKDDILGEMAIIDAASRTATAVAVTETILTVITKEQLTIRIHESDPIIKLLLRVLLERYRSGLSRVKGLPLEAASGLLNEIGQSSNTEHALHKINLESQLRQALDDDQLLVLYQPLMDLKTNQVTGFEALTRWQHPSQGMIPPDEFIGLAEETDLIVPVGLFVMEQACDDLVRLQSAAETGRGSRQDLFASINVSAKQLDEPDFLPRVAKVVAHHDLRPSQIKLEVTESLIIDPASMKRWAEEVHDYGFRIALDDFGTGYSSLGQLPDMDFDTLKIDKAFVQPMFSNPKAMVLLKTIVDLALGLNMDIIAEGVEERQHMQKLGELGVHYGQGYLISKPITVQEFETKLASSHDFNAA